MVFCRVRLFGAILVIIGPYITYYTPAEAELPTGDVHTSAVRTYNPELLGPTFKESLSTRIVKSISAESMFF